jgi:hypothetical protein
MDMDDHTQFTEEALRAQDGKKVPLTAYPGGPVIGEATLHYDAPNKMLKAEMKVWDPKAAELIGEQPSSIIFRQGE